MVAQLAAAGLTVAAAESLTGGLLTAALISVPGSSAVVRGGLVVYATDLKHTLADVPSALLAARGAVDPDVAAALAEGARRRCAADIGIGLTGVAGPDPQDGISAGTWYVALSGPSGLLRGESTAPVPGDDPIASRQAVRVAAVNAALALLRLAVVEQTHDRRR
ncbi:MAG: CinA family protein [Actinomycetota bacterium]|nr:CinA family protein [Actinomycetota bacterium]